MKWKGGGGSNRLLEWMKSVRFGCVFIIRLTFVKQSNIGWLFFIIIIIIIILFILRLSFTLIWGTQSHADRQTLVIFHQFLLEFCFYPTSFHFNDEAVSSFPFLIPRFQTMDVLSIPRQRVLYSLQLWYVLFILTRTLSVSLLQVFQKTWNN